MTWTNRASAAAAVAALAVMGAGLATAPASSAAAVTVPAAPFDVNGDGYADHAIGVPHEAVGDQWDAGALSVVRSGAGGIGGSGHQLWTQESAGVSGAAEAGDAFGSAVASGDFNRDGYADVAVGVDEIFDTVGEEPRYAHGAVTVLYGSSSGLRASSAQSWHQGSSGVPGAIESGDGFGGTLATGDFDGDGYADLAVGSPGEAIGPQAYAGAVTVLRGSPSGLTSSGASAWSQASEGVPGSPENSDEFGSSLASGDFDRDGYADLAVGVPGEDAGGASDGGVVVVLHGSATGVSGARSQRWGQDTSGITDAPEDRGVTGGDERCCGDRFGADVAAGDVDADGDADLAVAVPGERDETCTTGSCPDGAVAVLRGSASGLSASGDTLLRAGAVVPPGEVTLTFASDIALGDVDGDRRADLAVGAPDAAPSGSTRIGAVHVLRSDAEGPSAAGAVTITQDTPGAPGAGEAGDRFGASVLLGRFFGGTRAALAVTAPGEDLGGATDGGMLVVLPGSAGGLTGSGSVAVSQDRSGVPGAAESHDRLGQLGGCAWRCS
ncbi:MAG: integrin alpha [Actinomycetota bacterium]|nr:integrin alpha [Actinomycetota bacterium]